MDTRAPDSAISADDLRRDPNLEILSRSRDLMSVQIDSLEAAKRGLDESFVDVVQAILNCSGKVVFMGVGKSALVASKLSATFNSLGTPAVFLHGADCIHGDLGVVQAQDIVVALSFTGTTREMVESLPAVKRLKPTFVALVGNPNSPIARAADHVISINITKEAGTLGLAPTSSTTAMLVVGDTLAVIVSELKGFSEKDFVRFHPGGGLGRKLLLKVEDVMHRHSATVKTILPEDSITTVITALTTEPLGAVNVIASSEDLTLVGIITDGDIRRAAAHPETFALLKARDIMSKNPKFIHSSAMATQALDIMERRSSPISVLAVVDDNGRALGLVRIHDLY